MINDRVRTPIVVTHQGGTRFAAQVRSHQVFTDQPVAAGGTDTAASPIELLGASLGSCIAFYVQQFCAARGLPYEGMRVEIEQRSEKSPARVIEFIGRVIMPEELPEEYARMLDRVVRSCPAHNTLAGGAFVNIEVLVPVAR
jgi:putative redox protein